MEFVIAMMNRTASDSLHGPNAASQAQASSPRAKAWLRHDEHGLRMIVRICHRSRPISCSGLLALVLRQPRAQVMRTTVERPHDNSQRPGRLGPEKSRLAATAPATDKGSTVRLEAFRATQARGPGAARSARFSCTARASLSARSSRTARCALSRSASSAMFCAMTRSFVSASC